MASPPFPLATLFGCLVTCYFDVSEKQYTCQDVLRVSLLWETGLGPGGMGRLVTVQAPGPGAPRLLSQDPVLPHPRVGSGGCPVAEPDKLILTGFNCFSLTGPHWGGVGELAPCSVSSLRRENFLFVKEKSSANSSMALGHQSVLTKQHPNGLSINESGTYGSHLL